MVVFTFILVVCALIAFICHIVANNESHKVYYDSFTFAFLLLLPFALALTLVSRESDIKEDFMKDKYIKKYEYVDSVKVDSTWVLKEKYGIK